MSIPISARVDGSHYTHSVAPDVCLTPMGSGMVPVPYNTIAFYDRCDGASRTVRNNGDHDFQINTRPIRCYGHEPGTGKGICVPGYVSHAVIKNGAPFVFSEGWQVVRDGDTGEINRPGRGLVEKERTLTTVKIEHW
ncbi:PAAR-like domain-containing protein [Labrys sedimenti]|uniref:PAAR-like domain-containing protein n=1 Tax=Labrys sedimenti TaxID=3106036 RepID=UPI002ACAB7C7|nr:PAAR-like domain-containing protein [Labrys sp. ZIDIC5]MDZ5449888.1 PAAR-like domain-containing protein [Labrys sp. ZIDIC5]